MQPNSENGGRQRDEAERFSTYLSELKNRGSALLVVGELPRDSYSPFCENILGDPSSGPRCRLHVTTYENASNTRIRDPISASATPISSAHVVSTFSARSAAKASAAAMETDAVTHVEGEDLPGLGIAISQEIKKFDEERRELQPAELRLCFDSLRPLLEEYEEQQVFRFLDLVTNRIRSKSGMGHFHLPIDSDDRLVHTFAELFDAVIELDTRDGELCQCWNIRDKNLTSGWISV